MSRIEEALKRAAVSPAGSEMQYPVRDRFAIATKLRVRLDDFVAEHEASLQTPAEPSVSDHAGVPKIAHTTVTPHLLSRIPDVVDGKLISLKGTNPTSVEQYRRLATTLHGLQQQNGIKVLMVTSSAPREGKTLTSTNLALTFSESYKRRVLLIDGDLRRPFVHEIFGIPNTSGLGDGLRGEGASLPLVQVTPRLTVLPAGHPDSDPMAALSSERMRTVLKEAAERFEWVILDTPPVGLISDANLMAGFVDGVIFVIGANSTNYQVVESALTEIGRDRVIGTVLNRVEQDGAPAAGYYNHYHAPSDEQ